MHCRKDLRFLLVLKFRFDRGKSMYVHIKEINSIDENGKFDVENVDDDYRHVVDCGLCSLLKENSTELLCDQEWPMMKYLNSMGVNHLRQVLL